MTVAPIAGQRQRGFTIMELVIAIVIIGILSVVGVSMISDTFTTARIVNADQSSGNEARYAVERLAREIREVKWVDGDPGAYAISSSLSPASTNLVFTRDIGGADVVVTIDRSGTNLTLGYSSPATVSTLATQVSSFSLDFLAMDPAPATGSTSTTASAADVRFVVISVTVTDSMTGQSITERSRIALRNM